MKNSVSPRRTATEAPLEEQAARLYRRVGLLRARGKSEAADLLETGELEPFLLRAHADGVLDEGRWREIADRETGRIAEAQALAELLLEPLLAGIVPAVAGDGASPPEAADPAAARARPSAGARRAGDSRSSAPEDRRAEATPGPGGPHGAPRGIADFIDEMLELDRAGARQG